MKVREYSEIVFTYFVMSAFFALLALGLLYPCHPSTIAGSVFWLFAVLPVWMIGEGIGSIFINDKVGKFIRCQYVIGK